MPLGSLLAWRLLGAQLCSRIQRLGHCSALCLWMWDVSLGLHILWDASVQRQVLVQARW